MFEAVNYLIYVLILGMVLIFPGIFYILKGFGYTIHAILTLMAAGIGSRWGANPPKFSKFKTSNKRRDSKSLSIGIVLITISLISWILATPNPLRYFLFKF